jgi:phosphoribosylformylglycinamidine synthase PurS subunit
VARLIVEVMLKPEILDPQGSAIAAALARIGFAGLTSVRQGKRFEIEIEGLATAEKIAEIESAAELLLANLVIENFVVRVDE